MNDDFRNRAFLPIVIPLAIAAFVAGLIGLYAWMLLYNTREGAAALAIVAAAGVLVAIALAASQDTLGAAKKVGVGLAAIVPIGIGVAIAGGAFGLEASTLNINVEPHAPSLLLPEVPEDAPLLAAEDLSSFCLPSGGSCEPTQQWDVTEPEDAGEFVYAFNNRDTATAHNLALYPLPGEDVYGSGVQALGQPLSPSVPDTFTGDETRAYEFAWGAGGEAGASEAPADTASEAVGSAPEQFYFVCTIHPTTMWGVATVVDG